MLPGHPKVDLRVKSGFKQGSFGAEFEIIHSLIDLFSSKGASALANIIQILGVTGELKRFEEAVGFIQLILRAKGRPISKKPNTELQDSNKTAVAVKRPDIIEIEYSDGSTGYVEEESYRLYHDLRAREAAEKFVDPLREEGINQIRLKYQGDTSVHISEDDVDYFEAPKRESDMETTSEYNTTLLIVSISFRVGEKWRVSDGGETPFFVKITDLEYLKEIEEGKVSFTTRDMIHARLKIIQKVVDGQIKIEREIIKVFNHIHNEEQGELNLA